MEVLPLMTDEDTVTIPREEIESLLERWEDDAAYAERLGKMGEHDGVLSCRDELAAMVEEYINE